MQVKVLENILKANDAIAQENRTLFQQKRVLVLNVMSSPGSGKTSIIERTVKTLGKQFNIGVIEGDIASTYDAELLSKLDIPVVQINTEPFGGACHLEASWIRNAALSFDLEHLDILFIENIGNLVCPAEFDLGAAKNIVILSLPEGADKPIKYPLMFRKAQVLLINKVDLREALKFDLDTLFTNVQQINPQLNCFPLSAATGEGFDAWIEWLTSEAGGK